MILAFQKDGNFEMQKKVVEGVMAVYEKNKSNSIIALRCLTLTCNAAMLGEEEFRVCERAGENAALVNLLQSEDQLTGIIFVSAHVLKTSICLCYRSIE